MLSGPALKYDDDAGRHTSSSESPLHHNEALHPPPLVNEASLTNNTLILGDLHNGIHSQNYDINVDTVRNVRIFIML